MTLVPEEAQFVTPYLSNAAGAGARVPLHGEPDERPQVMLSQPSDDLSQCRRAASAQQPAHHLMHEELLQCTRQRWCSGSAAVL